MRQLKRPSLGSAEVTKLSELTAKVNLQPDHPTKVKEAGLLWTKSRRLVCRRRIAEHLYRMNSQSKYCMYCEYNESFVIGPTLGHLTTIVDHWKPRELAPELTFDWLNMFAACEVCNTRHKLAEFPQDSQGDPLLLHLVDDKIHDHIVFEPSNGALKEKNASMKGETTVDLFDLKRFERRRVAVWALLLEYLKSYDSLVSAADHVGADAKKADILDLPFPSLRTYLVQIALGPNGALLTTPEIPEIVTRHNVGAWG